MKKINLPISSSEKNAIPIYFVSSNWKKEIGKKVSKSALNWANQSGFSGGVKAHCILPDAKGAVEAILFNPGDNPLNTGKLAKVLPNGNYAFAAGDHHNYLGYLLGAYRFTDYKNQGKVEANIFIPKKINKAAIVRESEATFLTRDLINIPTNDLGPDELEKTTREIAKKFGAKISVVKGAQLLKKNFPMVHAVGRASDKLPRLIELNWGNPRAKKITLIGKGVCFDTGGLNIKPGNSMALMKKDMGGAANVLGLAYMIMAAKLKVRLKLLIPAVENNISANAYRPGDILDSRKGLTVEIGNTDAEGRLILADALTYASESKPDLIVDMATLTGAARVALGPDLPPFYSDDQTLANRISKSAEKQVDPLWQMPLWKPYVPNLGSKVADTNHITSGGFAGSITAALFLQKFVDPNLSWVHFDVYGWSPSAKPWCNIGGEAQCIRALFHTVKDHYC